MGDKRVGMEQDPFDPTEYRRVSSDAECQAKKGQARKTGISPEHAGAETEVLPELIRPQPDALLPGDFFDLLYAAELLEGSVSCLVCRHASGNVSLDQTLDMLTYLLCYFRITAVLMKQSEQARKPGTKSRHKFRSRPGPG